MKDQYLRRRLWRKLESLPDERLYQVVDYVEFLEAKYGEAASDPDGIQRLAEGVQDRMRRRPRGRWAYRGMMGALGLVDRTVGTAARAVRGLADEVAEARRRQRDRKDAPRSEASSTRIVVE
jgi:hypothetical protein